MKNFPESVPLLNTKLGWNSDCNGKFIFLIQRWSFLGYSSKIMGQHFWAKTNAIILLNICEIWISIIIEIIDFF